MQKMFALLVAELRKLGAAIVFASFSKIIIDTGKSDVSAAKAYCDSVIKTVQNRSVYLLNLKIFPPTHLVTFGFLPLFLCICRELFEWIELEPLQFWHSLVFMDQVSYCSLLFFFLLLIFWLCYLFLHFSKEQIYAYEITIISFWCV